MKPSETFGGKKKTNSGILIIETWHGILSWVIFVWNYQTFQQEVQPQVCYTWWRSLNLLAMLQVSNWESDRSLMSQQEDLETAHTWLRRWRVTNPVVTPGSWSVWIHVLLMMRSYVAPALGSHKSCVSTATVRGEQSHRHKDNSDFKNICC